MLGDELLGEGQGLFEHRGRPLSDALLCGIPPPAALRRQAWRTFRSGRSGSRRRRGSRSPGSQGSALPCANCPAQNLCGGRPWVKCLAIATGQQMAIGGHRWMARRRAVPIIRPPPAGTARFRRGCRQERTADHDRRVAHAAGRAGGHAHCRASWAARGNRRSSSHCQRAKALSNRSSPSWGGDKGNGRRGP